MGENYTDKILMMCQCLCCEKISVDEQLIISGLLDSFKIMELICSLEDEFQVAFLPEEISDISNFSCVGNIANIISSKMKSIDSKAEGAV